MLVPSQTIHTLRTFCQGHFKSESIIFLKRMCNDKSSRTEKPVVCAYIYDLGRIHFKDSCMFEKGMDGEAFAKMVEKHSTPTGINLYVGFSREEKNHIDNRYCKWIVHAAEIGDEELYIRAIEEWKDVKFVSLDEARDYEASVSLPIRVRGSSYKSVLSSSMWESVATQNLTVGRDLEDSASDTKSDPETPTITPRN